MRTIPYPRAAVAFLVAGATALASLATQHAETKGKVEQVLLQEALSTVPGKQGSLLRVDYPPGWVGKRHYHTGDVFLYVLEGSFTVEVEGGKRTTLGRGEVYHEAVKTVMQARNPSASETTSILVFQVGNVGERLTVDADR